MSLPRRPYETAAIALLGAGCLVATPVLAPSPSPATRTVQLTGGEAESDGDLVGLIVGGSGTPIPELNDDYVQDANELYIQQILPGADSHGVFTPEGLSPIYTGVKSLPLDTSVDQGATMLDSYITDVVGDGNPDDNTVAVFGESQSSTIAGFVMDDLEDAGIGGDDVKFSLVGDPSNPAGGLLERFDELALPSLGITFSGATPPDTVYETDIYTQEYDGFADFPKYPINFLADLNAFIGIQAVHPTYRDLTPEDLDNAHHLATTDDYHGDTDYYLIEHDTLPLADLIRQIPGIGQPLGDFLEPALRDVVNIGYDNPDPTQGWDDVGAANVPTEFELFPEWDQVAAALERLGPDLQAGLDAAMADLTDPGESAADPFTDAFADGDPASPTDIVNAFTGALSQAYSVLLPTTDIVNALTTTLPAYDLDLFTDALQDGDLVSAFGMPLAADTGLLTLAAGIELMVVEQTVSTISDNLDGIF